MEDVEKEEEDGKDVDGKDVDGCCCSSERVESKGENDVRVGCCWAG